MVAVMSSMLGLTPILQSVINSLTESESQLLSVKSESFLMPEVV